MVYRWYIELVNGIITYYNPFINSGGTFFYDGLVDTDMAMMFDGGV